MANYVSYMRTGYFNVKDPQEFKKEMSELLDDNVDVDIEIGDDNKICMYGENFAFIYQEQEDGSDDLEIDVFARIQEHLLDGEAVLINSIGYEKLRYLHGASTILTNTGQVTVNAENEVRTKAVDAGLVDETTADTLLCEY